MQRYPRDMSGHGPNPPDPQWPGGARIAVQIVVNYEEGGENNILHGDAASEAFLSEIVGAAAWPGQRHWNMESIYEYGARAGFWRLHRMLRALPVTVYGVPSRPEVIRHYAESGVERCVFWLPPAPAVEALPILERHAELAKSFA